MEDKCFFACTNDSPSLINCGPGRIKTIRNFSIRRGDGLVHKLEQVDSLKCHKNCVSTYTSEHHLKRFLRKRKPTEADTDKVIPPKKTRRSGSQVFSFKEHCLFCGETCEPLDARHPDRWKKVVKCRTADNFKQNILDVCDVRNDNLANDVRVRVTGAVSDLHAADGQYHESCYKHFTNVRNVQAAAKSCVNFPQPMDSAFSALVKELSEGESQLWNSIEIQEIYVKHGGTSYSRRKLIDKLVNHFGDDLLVLSGSGVASILVFRSKASHLLKVVDDKTNSYIDVKPMASIIRKECSDCKADRDTYNTRLFVEDATEACSDQLLNLLAALSPKLDHTNTALLIGNIITSVLNNRPTTLQITIGTVLREKALIEQLSEYGISCSYDEVLRFKKSVAHAASRERDLQGLKDNKHGLLQAVADNFDANISSPNGLKSTHSLALLLTQVQENMDTDANLPMAKTPTIPRLSKEKAKEEPLEPVDVQHYNGPRKPAMAEVYAKHQVLPLKILAAKVITTRRAEEADYKFLCKITAEDSTPEYNGFNTEMARSEGHSIKPATKAIYTPLIDMKPSDPDTIMTAMVESQRIMRECNQTVTLFTLDQQLYRVSVDILWAYPDQFQNFIPRLGGMHMLMSFIGAVGTLMTNSGLEELMNSAFGGVQKMLSGKKFPQNLRALRMVVEEVLRDVIPSTHSFAELISTLDERASMSRTAKLWVDNLIKPVFIMMQFVRAEREGDWPLHLVAVAAMVPYFFSSAHFNYARYSLFYLRSMEALPEEMVPEFLKGNHVMRHNPGIWNGIWSDMFIESTFMRYGHEAGGLVGLTLQPSAVTRWALSLHVCGQLSADLSAMKDGQNRKVMTTHKEEFASRIRNDAADRDKLRATLGTFIHPLHVSSHPSGIVNIATGLVSPPGVNVDKALAIGQQQKQEFESGWPVSFHGPLKKNVVPMPANNKSIKIDGMPVYDTELIYTRVLGLQQSRNLNIKDILAYELSAVPPAIFDENGDMRTQAKATLKQKLQVELSARLSSSPDAIVIDGCALLWGVHWPPRGTVEDYIRNFMGRIKYYLKKCSVYLIFDRYPLDSTKNATRSNRAGKNASRRHVLTLHTLLPAQKVVLNVTQNKTQLISLICQYLIDNLVDNTNELVITSEQPVPVLVVGGECVPQNDLRNTHEEADVIIIHQVVYLADHGKSNICVVCDDTDVFILLIHFYSTQKLICDVTMESPVNGRCVIDIKATADKHKAITDDLPAAHALTGCDTTSYLCGIGKGTALKTLNSGKSLQLLGREGANIDEVVAEAVSFISACYGSKCDGNLSETRYAIWSTKMANPKISSAPKIKSLPPTIDAFAEHVKRAHYQTMIWKASLLGSPPTTADPLQYGWTKKEGMLSPVMLPADVSPVPLEVIKLIKCGCSSVRSCSSSRCSCVYAQMSCSIFCVCHAGLECYNVHTRGLLDVPDELDENEDT